MNNVIGANGSLIVPGGITDAASFSSWWQTHNANSVGANDITVTPASGLSLVFTPSGSNTLITAVPEPSAAMALLGGTATLLGLRRRRFVA